jgi:hypothetical protein
MTTPKKLPKATHTGVLRFGDAEVDCYVLEDGSRQIAQRAFLRAIGVAETTAFDRQIPRILGDSSSLASSPTCRFIMPGGGTAIGRSPKDFVDFLGACQDKLFSGDFHESQRHILLAAAKLGRALMGAAIEKLIDDACGYASGVPFQDNLQAWFRDERNFDVTRIFSRDFLREYSRIARWKYVEGAPPSMGFIEVAGKMYRLIAGDEVYKAWQAKNEALTTQGEGKRPRREMFQNLSPDALDMLRSKMHVATILARQVTTTAQFWNKFRDAVEPTGAGYQYEIEDVA